MNEENTTASTVLIVGAGRGIGLAVARRFSRSGAAVGLIARSPQRLAELSSTLESEGIMSAWAVADATDAAQVRAAIRDIVEQLGPVDVACFSPLPAIDLIKPVLETEPQDLVASFTLNVGGAAAVVSEVAPGMIERAHGSLLFTTGSGALHPSSERAASAVTTAAETLYVRLVRDALTPKGVRVIQLAIVGAVGPGKAHEPADVADALWSADASNSDALTVLR
jgi:NADP-dependent 3-hydroxy acid dehydrogenase YdfG